MPHIQDPTDQSHLPVDHGSQTPGQSGSADQSVLVVCILSQNQTHGHLLSCPPNTHVFAVHMAADLEGSVLCEVSVLLDGLDTELSEE